jgi:Meiotically up-regulated gene 113
MSGPPSREHIIAEIRRTAEENGGTPLGQDTFMSATGISQSKWRGMYWRNWSDAVREAGLEPNRVKEPLGREAIAFALTKLAARLGRLPTQADMRLEKRADPTFPTTTVFDRQIGRRADLIELVRGYAGEHAEFRGVLTVLPPVEHATAHGNQADLVDGAVYMLKLGRHYKIGKSFRVPQRHREIAIELPEKPDVVHIITTDDPTGIEAYWHARFAAKRTNGEWFALTADDVRAFKRRRFM